MRRPWLLAIILFLLVPAFAAYAQGPLFTPTAPPDANSTLVGNTQWTKQQIAPVANGTTPFLATGGTSAVAPVDRAAFVFNVKDYGIFSGSLFSLPVTINSGQTNLSVTSTTPVFPASAAGQPIFIGGACSGGTCGSEIASTIATVVDGTHITLSTTAGTTFSGSTQRIVFGPDIAAAYNTNLYPILSALPAASTAAGIAAQVVFPNGVYVVSSASLNMTSLTGVVFSGAGATLYGAFTGYPVMDGLLARNTVFDGFKVIGDITTPPTAAIQIGRVASGSTATGRNTVRNISTDGYFSIAARYSLGSETTLFSDTSFYNNDPGAYACIDDGINHTAFGLTSQYQSITLPANTPFTNTNQSFVQDKCIAFGTGSGAYWMANAVSRSFSGEYLYSPTYGIVLYGANSSRNQSVSFSGTIEGVTDDFFVTGTDAAQAVTQFTADLTVTDPTKPTDALIKTDTPTVTSANCFACNVRVSTLPSGAVGITSPTLWSWGGNILAPTSTGWTLPSTMNGMVCFGASCSYYGAGLLQIGSSAAVTSSGAAAVGPSTTAQGTGAVALGNNTHANNNNVLAVGQNSFSVRLANFCFASGSFTTNGDSQSCKQMLRASSSSTSTIRLTSNAGAATTTNVVNVPTTFNASYLVQVFMVGRDTSTGDVATWSAGPFIMKVGANAAATSLPSSPTFTPGYTSAAGCIGGATLPTLAADTTNGGLNISVTPNNSDTCHWVALAWTPVEVQ